METGGGGWGGGILSQELKFPTASQSPGDTNLLVEFLVCVFSQDKSQGFAYIYLILC